MLLLLILPLLISGYCVQQWSFKHFYQLHRYTGQLLYLKSAYLGAVCLCLSFFLSSFLLLIQPFIFFEEFIGNGGFLEFLKLFFENTLNINRPSLPFFSMLVFNSFLVALIWAHIGNFLNIFYRFLKFNTSEFESKYNRKARFFKDRWSISKTGYIFSLKQELFADNPLDNLLMDAYENPKFIMLHMNDRKIYIGKIASLSEPTESDSLAQEITLLPIKSGYRDKDKLTADITTNYDISKALFIVLRRNEILSATIYNEEIFKNFMSEQVDKTKKSYATTINYHIKNLK